MSSCTRVTEEVMRLIIQWCHLMRSPGLVDKTTYRQHPIYQRYIWCLLSIRKKHTDADMATQTSARAPRHKCLLLFVKRGAIPLRRRLRLRSAVYLLSAVICVGNRACSALAVTTSLRWGSMTQTLVILHRNSEGFNGSRGGQCMTLTMTTSGWMLNERGSVSRRALRVLNVWEWRVQSTYWGWWCQIPLSRFSLSECWLISL